MAVQVVPAQRWDIDAYYAPDATSNLKMDVRLAAFVPSFDCFDAAAFRCKPPNSCLSDLIDSSLQKHL